MMMFAFKTFLLFLVLVAFVAQGWTLNHGCRRPEGVRQNNPWKDKQQDNNNSNNNNANIAPSIMDTAATRTASCAKDFEQSVIDATRKHHLYHHEEIKQEVNGMRRNSGRREFFQRSFVSWSMIFFLGNKNIAWARVPGSKDVTASVQQIREAAIALRRLNANFDQYAQIDAEGRAGSTDEARRILGGIAPQAGTVAIQVAQSTPLYRIDNALTAVRNAALQADDDDSDSSLSSSFWPAKLDLVTFEELVDRLLYSLQKADGDFYSVLFAAKGTTQIQGIFTEAKRLVQQSIRDLDDIIALLDEAGAPS